MSFSAKYDGVCGDCGIAIYRGQAVTYQGEDGVVHVMCPTEQKVCPKCHMALPATGVCDDCS